VAKIFTTEFSTALDGVAAVVDGALGTDCLASGVGVTAGGPVSAGALNPVVINEQETRTSAKIVVARGRGRIIQLRNAIRGRKRAGFFKRAQASRCWATGRLAWCFQQTGSLLAPEARCLRPEKILAAHRSKTR